MKYCAHYRVRAQAPHRRRCPRRLAPACGPGPRTLARMWPLLLGIAAYQPGGGALAWARKAKTKQNRAFCIIRLQAFAGAIQNNLFCIIFDGEMKPGPTGKRATRPCLLSHQPAAREPQAQRRAPTPPPKAGGKSTPPAPVHGGARKGKKGLTSSPPRGNIKERKGRCPGSADNS